MVISFRRVFVSCALIAFAAATFSAPARAVALADTESQYYANLEAFETTAASRSSSCQTMIEQANAMSSNPQLRSSPAMTAALAIDSAQCLQSVRQETRDFLPTKIPRNLLMVSCQRIRAYPVLANNVSHYCAVLQFKAGTHLYGF